MNIDMTDSFSHRLKIVDVIRQSKQTVDFKPVYTDQKLKYKMAIQMANPENLQKDNVDWSKQYIWAFSKQEFKINDFVIFQGLKFKVIDLYNVSLYGYWKAICEETKENEIK